MLKDREHGRVARSGEVGENENAEVKQPDEGEDQESGLLVSIHVLSNRLCLSAEDKYPSILLYPGRRVLFTEICAAWWDKKEKVQGFLFFFNGTF
jgi:hypothetical protein